MTDHGTRKPSEDDMKLLKILLIPIVAYDGLVALFEIWLGIAQPVNEATITITTTNGQGVAKRRVLTRVESNGQLYVSANHWPRGWYRDAIRRPRVTVDADGEVGSYRAVKIEGADQRRAAAQHRLSNSDRFSATALRKTGAGR